MTIRDARTNAIYDVEDDGRRLSITVAHTGDTCCAPFCDGTHGEEVTVTFSRADLLELLGVKQ